MMFLNWMRCGHLFPARTTNAGYGQRCVVALCKWLPSFLATIVLELVPNCGRKFLKVINAVTPSVISGFEVENPQPLTDSEYLGFSTSKAYAKVFPKATHRMVGKEAGETCHMERWNCTLRQRLARFVRKTLSFSKSDVMLKGFIADYNLSRVSES
jgi:hypothetical protein